MKRDNIFTGTHRRIKYVKSFLWVLAHLKIISRRNKVILEARLVASLK